MSVSVFLPLAVTSCYLAAAAPEISVDIYTDERLPATTAQEWARRLGELNLDNVRIRGRSSGEAVEVSDVGTAQRPRYKVVGKIAADGTLQLPRAKFSARDAGSLKRYLTDLARTGIEGVTEERGTFGLLPSQVGKVKADLAQPVAESTAGRPATDVVQQITRQMQGPIASDRADERALAGLTVDEELRGVACGTALALVLRPAGLAFAPALGDGGSVRYRLAQGRTLDEIWPIGWEPDKPPRETLPAIVESINVEIEAAPLDETLATIAARLKVPLWYDHNALVRHGIDVHQDASLPGAKLMYAQIVRKLVAKAKLKYELRIDDAGKPFLWITTVKPIERAGVDAKREAGRSPN